MFNLDPAFEFGDISAFVRFAIAKASNKMALNHSFTGKKVLITGGAKGIGRAIVNRLSADGAEVYVLQRNPELARKLEEELPNVKVVCVDVTNWTETREAILSFGALDHVVNSAGVLAAQPFMDLTEEDAELHMATNYKSIINIVQSAAQGMIQSGNGGSIVNILSLAAHITVGGLTSYSCSKAAAGMLTKSMAIELGKYKIRVNSVSPTAVETDMMLKLPDTTRALLARAINPRPLVPDELVDTVLFLLSPGAGMIYGEDIIVDGGVRTC